MEILLSLLDMVFSEVRNAKSVSVFFYVPFVFLLY